MPTQESSIRGTQQDHQEHGPSQCEVAQSELSAAQRTLQEAYDRRAIEGQLTQGMGMLGTSGVTTYRGLSDLLDLDSDEKRAKAQLFNAKQKVKKACEK